MGVQRTVKIDMEHRQVGQFDRVERWKGQTEIAREEDGRLRIGGTDVGVIFDYDDLVAAIRLLDAGAP